MPFRFALFLENGEPADPAVFVVANPVWNEGDVFMPRGGERFRILAIEPLEGEDAPSTRPGP
jgi:hypothetical protein